MTRAVVEEGRRETLTVLKKLEGRVPMPKRRLGVVEGLVNFTARREA